MLILLSKKNIILFLFLLFVFGGASTVFHHNFSSAVSKVVTNTIILDAGHGGEDGGAIGISGSKEKDINLAVTLKLKQKLLDSGFNVIMTRESDIMLCDEKQQKKKKLTDLKNRVAISTKNNEAIFLSIHMNHYEDITQKGAQVFYSVNNSMSEEIAKNIQNELKETVDQNNRREIKPSGKEIYILDKIKTPACLIECGFISNPTEEQLLLNEDYQNKIADAITNGIIKSKS